jgi:hypothetical protein
MAISDLYEIYCWGGKLKIVKQTEFLVLLVITQPHLCEAQVISLFSKVAHHTKNGILSSTTFI